MINVQNIEKKFGKQTVLIESRQYIGGIYIYNLYRKNIFEIIQ